MSASYESLKRRLRMYALAWLIGCALCSAAAVAAEPGVYPQTPYAPPVLPADWQTPIVAEHADGYIRPVVDYTDPSSATFPDSVPRHEDFGGLAYQNSDCDTCRGGRRYAGGQWDAWMWGCGGSPFRTGPGWCDTWKVGPVWDVSVDGMTLQRDEVNLGALEAVARADEEDLILGDPRETQFGYSGGARIWAMGKYPRWEPYQVQFGYQGIEEWNAALLFPEDTVGVDTDGVAGDEYEYDAVRSLHYRSSMHSAEMNFFHRPEQIVRMFCGIRYVRFKDEITDTTDQDAPFPPPVAAAPDPVVDAVTLEDSFDYIDIKNNLIGVQLGLREDLWRVNRRVSLQGFVNAGVYYNHIQYSEGSYDTTTTFIPDDGTTVDVNEAQSLTSRTASVSSSEPSDVAYLAEASLTVLCRLNRCVALRGGYQLFWVDGLALAEDAYRGDALDREDFLMQGWHAGVEYRR